MESEKIIAADIGNSRLKILESGFYGAYEYDNNLEINFLNYLNSIKNSETQRVIFIYSSVNTKILDKILLINSNFQRIENIDCRQILIKQNRIDYSEIQNIGSDRLVGLFRASELYDLPIVTVDCGTAVTINALDETGKVAGGAIFAGVKTQLRALASSTANLNEIEMYYESDSIGKDTATALRIGIIKGIAGAIQEIISNICKYNFNSNIQKVSVILTGGYSKIIMEALLGNSQFIPVLNQNLVCEGILSLYKNFK